MAKRPREILLRKHEQAIKALDRCLLNLQHLQTAYAPAHPEQHKMVSSLCRMVIEAQTLVQQFKDQYM